MRRFLATSAGALVYALAAALGASRFAVGPGVLCAVVGSLLGIWVARRLAASRLRLPAIWGFAFLFVLAAALVAGFSRGSVPIPLVLGARGAYTFADMIFWGALALAAVAVLQATSRRKPWFLAVELGAVGGIFASLFAAHREGFINRPYGLVDPLWGRGYDPLPIFLALGAGVAALLAVLAVARNRGRRSVLDLVILGALVLALFLAFPVAKLKDIIPPSAGSGAKEEGKGKHEMGSASGKEKSETGNQKTGGTPKGQGQRGDKGQGPSGAQGQDEGGVAGQGSLSSFANQSGGHSNQPVAVVLLHDDYNPSSGYYYFRETAFSQYNGLRLVQDTTGKADLDLADAFPTQAKTLPAEPRNAKIVRSLLTTVALIAMHTKPFGLINPARFEPAPNPDATRFQRAYKVSSLVLDGGVDPGVRLSPGSKRWSQALWEHYTAAPQDPRYEKLAKECLDLLKPELRENPFARAAAVKIFLEKKGTYSLTSNHEQAADPLANFLFGDRVGHCVYFAHSACLLFRTLGLPSRVGAGYAVEARNRGGGDAVLVREKDAHAWPEIYLEGLGWTVLDISPEKVLTPPEPGPDPGLQQMLGDMARQQPGSPNIDQKPAGEGDIQKAMKTALKVLALLAALLLALALLVLYATKLWRRMIPAYCAERELPRVAYRACLDRLAEAGVVRPYGTSREAFARSGPLSPSLEALTVLHLRRALGREEGAGRGMLLQFADQAVAERLAGTARWRRALGLLDPFAWLRVK